MIRVRRNPVARDASVPRAMLRLERSGSAGALGFPPIARRLPGSGDEAPDRFPDEWKELALGGGGQVPQVDHAAVRQAGVQEPPEVPTHGIRVRQLAGGMEVQEFLPAREVL